MECSICYEKYSNEKIPMLLLCGHTFCCDCMKIMMENYSVSCPLCKKMTIISLGANHSDKFPNDLLLPNLTLIDALLIRSDIKAPEHLNNITLYEEINGVRYLIGRNNSYGPSVITLLDNDDVGYNAGPIVDVPLINAHNELMRAQEQQRSCCKKYKWNFAYISCYVVMKFYLFMSVMFIFMWIKAISEIQDVLSVYLLGIFEILGLSVWIFLVLVLAGFAICSSISPRVINYAKKIALVNGLYLLVLAVWNGILLFNGFGNIDDFIERLLIGSIIFQVLVIAIPFVINAAVYSYNRVQEMNNNS